MRMLLIAVLLAPWSLVYSAKEPPDPFVGLFAQSCVRHFTDQDKLRELLTSQDIRTLPAGDAASFLGGQKGTAWAVEWAGRPYILALRDDRVCAVFAQRASARKVQEGFASMVSTPPKPMVAAKLDDAFAGPNNDNLTSVAYAWSRPEDKVQIQFTLTTSNAEAAGVQAMATMAVTRKPGAGSKGQ